MPAKTIASQLVLPADVFTLSPPDVKRFAEEQAMGMVMPTDPVLTKRADDVTEEAIVTPNVQQVVKRLMQVAGGQQSVMKGVKTKSGRRMLVGLAAPQIGESLRIIVVDTRIDKDRKEPGFLECFINPEIIWRTHETVEGREGCFSAGPVWGLVRRPAAVKIRAHTADGQKVVRVFEDFSARIVQHEIDHLDGIRFPERIHTDRKRHWVYSDEIKAYVLHINHWPRICTRERWEAFKQGKML